MAESTTFTPPCTAASTASAYAPSVASSASPRYVPMPIEESTSPPRISRKCPAAARPWNRAAYRSVPSAVADPPLRSRFDGATDDISLLSATENRSAAQYSRTVPARFATASPEKLAGGSRYEKSFLHDFANRDSLGYQQLARLQTQRGPVAHKCDSSADRAQAADRYRPWRTNRARQGSGKQRTDWRHAHEHHGVHRHGPSTKFVRHHGLNQRVRAGHLQHDRVTHRNQQCRRQPERFREREKDQRNAEADRRQTHDASQTTQTSPQGQSESAEKRANSRRAHQNPQPMRAAMQHAIREDRHQHGIRHRDQTDQPDQ